MTPTHDAAVALLLPIWRSIPPDYKAKYKFTIWTQFEANVRSAAYTSSLPKFLSRICSRLQITLTDAGLSDVRAVCASGHAREILQLFRDESAFLVTCVRLAVEEQRQAKQEAAS